jgi:SAM-dependent methyltransferase
MTDDRYPHLFAYAARTANLIVNARLQRHMGQWHDPEKVLDPQVIWLAQANANLSAYAAADPPPGRRDGPAYDLLDHTRTWTPGARLESGLWRRLMCEWPMSDYADSAVTEIRRHLQPGRQRILELGAGVGNTTRPLAPHIARTGGFYIRTDQNLHLMPDNIDVDGIIIGWNFDRPWHHGLTGDFDIIHATNALHCALDPATTIAHLKTLLAPEGRLIITEGAPTIGHYTPPLTRPDGTFQVRPWALHAAFGIFDGWWNRGGFRPYNYWIDTLDGIGTPDPTPEQTTGHAIYQSGYRVGTTYTWRRPR